MRIILFVLLFVVGDGVVGQNNQLLYNMNSLPQNLMTNPGGEVRFDMHAGVPLLSHISFAAGSSGVSMYDIFGGGKSVNENIGVSITEMTDRDFFSVRDQVELLYLGWRDKQKNYFSAGVYQEADLFAYFPKDLAVLAWEGNETQKNFHISDLAFTGEVLSVFHLGFSHQYSQDLRLGVRGKIYSSIVNIRSIDNQGDFFTRGSQTPGQVTRPVLREVDILVRTSGLSPLLNTESMSSEELMAHFRNKIFLGGNLGVGIDLGFTYFLSDQYRLTGSILDIGMLKHTEDTRTYRYYGELDSASREESNLDPDDPDSGKLGEYFQEEELTDPYISTVPVKLNASLDYGFGEELEPCNCREPMKRRRYKNHIGLHLFTMKRPRGLVHAATISFDKKFSRGFTGKVTYTADSFSYTNIGLLFSGRISDFNLYLAADNLLDYPNLARARNASLQLGLQFILDKG